MEKRKKDPVMKKAKRQALIAPGKTSKTGTREWKKNIDYWESYFADRKISVEVNLADVFLTIRFTLTLTVLP
jgi:hypothetical protein